VILYLYLGRVGYEEGLLLQREIAALVTEGRLANVLLLLEHPAVVTLGRNANRSNVKASDDLLALRGVTLHATNRGGDVTYHGPGQLVGYPIFNLRSLKREGLARMGAVDFVRALEEVLIRSCLTYGVRAGRIAGLTGVWCGLDSEPLATQAQRQAHGEDSHPERKIGAIGIHVARGVTSHGFAFNVNPNLRDFELIVPCGITDRAVTSLEGEVVEAGRAVADPGATPSLEAVAHQVARQFGAVFNERILAVESLAGLRGMADKLPRQFPAEDTPLQIPAEVERLHQLPNRPVRA
jgi:lipoyl(octanoyl) transferase